MSHHDEHDKLERSVELYQMIYDRQIDSEIGYAIRKLLEVGVIVDFQDQTRNKKTAIHLAVDKGDVIGVKFLLRFKPCLEVEDGDGKTPIALAESKGNQNILNVLLNSTVDVVIDSYVEVIDYESLTRQKVEAIKSRPTFKVLKLINCPSVNDVLKKITHRAYITTFNESSHLFIIAIETYETNIQIDHELMKEILNLRRPMIVQLTTSDGNNSKIYFKDDQKDFVEIKDTPQITQEEFNFSNEASNFKLLIAALRSSLFGEFTGDLLATKLNTSEDRSEAVNQFASSNALCHRFFKLFDKSQPQNETITAALSFKGDQSLLALLDLPFEPKDGKMKLTEYQQDILGIVDSIGCNLLMMAAELKNLDAVKLLLRCGCDVNHSDNYGKRSSDICWETKIFGCLAELIEAGSPYPSNFRMDEVAESSEACEKINAMIEATNSFHEHIKQGETEEVEKFIASCPHIKHAYDTKNKCALTVALEAKEVDIYSLLLSKGFEPGADDEYYDALVRFEKKFKIRNSHQKYFKEAFDEPHLKRLAEKSKLSFGSKDRAKCSTIIRKMFDELNEIEELIPILKICSLADKLRIVFDFNCDCIVDMDPTKESKSLGAVYPADGFIYIGAKNHETEFFEIIGHLIHELTHYAMKLTYENSCKPYGVGDIARRQIFENISIETKRICDENSSTDPIVTTVFNCYDGGVWHAELIVRVTQLLAHYKMRLETLGAAERNTPELFHFYREKTMKDVDAQSKVMLQKYLISKINMQTGIAREIENLNVQFEHVELDLKPSVNVITSNAPLLTLAMLHQVDCADSHIFVSLKQVALGNILDKIAKVNANESSTILIVDCIGQAQKYHESLKRLMKSMKNIKSIALVMNEAESSKVKENFPQLESETFDHKWAELTESSKAHLLDQNVIFQGVEMKLSNLVEPSSTAMNFFPLGSIVDCKDFKIGHELHQTSHKFYIPRKFIKNGQANAKSFEELSRDDPKKGSMIISDDAGSGKSVALFEIAKSLRVTFPKRWVLFVDLKRHIEAFKSIKDCQKIETFEDFIVQNILNKIVIHDTKSDEIRTFDGELFKQMFRAGKTFVLFDGFDEISPNYKDLLLHVLRLFYPGSDNQLYITSRPHLEADLEGALGKFVFKLETFSEESQISFLRDYWRSVGFEISHEDFEALSSRLLEKFSIISASKFIGLPLLMSMTVEIFDDPIEENLLRRVESLSISSVFEKFVEKYFLRWTNNENEISRGENVEFQMTGGVLEVHHNIALNHIFDDKFARLDVDESDTEKISRVGLIRYDKSEKTFQFIHETFAEYFVANFICFHLNKMNRDPSHEYRKAAEVLVEVLMGYKSLIRYEFVRYEVIETFLGQSLETMRLNQSLCKSAANCLSEVMKSTNNFDFLWKCLFVSPEKLSSLSMSIVKQVEKEVLLKMLNTRQPKTFFYENVLCNAATHSSKAIVSMLCDLITTCTDNPKEFYQYEGIFGNVLLGAAQNKNEGVLTALSANLSAVLREDELKIMFQQIMHGENIIAIAAEHSDEVFFELLSLLPKYLSPDETKSLLLAVNRYQQNFFHLAVQNRGEILFGKIIEYSREALSNDEIKPMLKQKDSKGSNVLHYIAEHGNVIVLKELNSLLRECLSEDEIRSLMLEVNKRGQNCFRLAANNTKLNIQIFCETIGDLLPIEDQARLLQQSIHEIDIIRLVCGNYNTMEILPVESVEHLMTKKDREGHNAFQKMAKEGDVDTWRKLISFAQARFTAEEMKRFLLCCDNNDQNCLQIAVSGNSNTNVIGAICETIKSVFSADELIKFVQQKGSDKKNVFRLAVESEPFKCYSLFDGLSTIMSKDGIKEILKEKDSYGNNILCNNRQYPFYNGQSIELIQFLRKILTIDEIKILLFEVDSEGKNLFHWAVDRLAKFEIKFLSKSIKEILSQDEQKKFFYVKSVNVFQLAAKNLNGEIFSTTYECLKDVLSEEEIKSLIQEKNSEKQNCLHLICLPYTLTDNYKRLRDFLRVLRSVCDADELRNFMTCSDNNGRNSLLVAAQFQEKIFFQELISFIRSEISIVDRRNLIQKCDNDGKNIVMCASTNQNEDKMLSFVETFDEILCEK